jgi:hypothetical protein
MNRQMSWGGGVNSWSLNTIIKGYNLFHIFLCNMEILGFDPNQWMWMDGSVWLFDG